MRRGPSAERGRMPTATSPTFSATPLHLTALPDLAHAIIASFLRVNDHLHVCCCSRRLSYLYRTQVQALTLRRCYYTEGQDDSDDEEDEEEEGKEVTMEETVDAWVKRAALNRLLQGVSSLRVLSVPDGRAVEVLFDAMRLRCLTRLESLSISCDEHWAPPEDEWEEEGETVYGMDEDDERILACAMRVGALMSLQSLDLGLITGDGLHHVFGALSTGACPMLASLSLGAYDEEGWDMSCKGNADLGAMMQARATKGGCSAFKCLVVRGWVEGEGVVGLQQALTSPLCATSLEKLGVIGGWWQQESSEVGAVAVWLLSGCRGQLQSLELSCGEVGSDVDEDEDRVPPSADAVVGAIACNAYPLLHLTHLRICNCTLGPVTLRTLTDAINMRPCLPSLTSLDLSGGDSALKSPLHLCTDGEARPLVCALVQHCTQLRDLSLDADCQPAGIFRGLAQGLFHNPTSGPLLCKLNLSGSQCTLVEAQKLAMALRANDAIHHTLTELHMSACGLNHNSSDLIAVLAERTVLPALQSLDLSRNILGDEQVKLVVSGVYPSLTSLDLADVGLTPAGLKAVGECFCRHDPLDPSFPRLRSLDLSGVDSTAGVVHVNTIAHALSGSAPIAGTLVRLKLERGGLGPAGAKLLARALCAPNAAKLRVLHIGGNALGAKGVTEFCDGLRIFAAGGYLQFRDLGLEDNGFGKSAGEHLLDALARLHKGGHLCCQHLLLRLDGNQDEEWFRKDFRKALRDVEEEVASCWC